MVAPAVANADILVGSGSTLSLGDANLDFGCGNLTIAGVATATSAALSNIDNLDLAGGVFSPNGATLHLGGNFSNAGSFSPGTSAVTIDDSCGLQNSLFSGATSFYTLAIVSLLGKQAIFPVGLAQSVAHNLSLQGAAGKPLFIVSSTAGKRGIIALAQTATQNVVYVDARDNKASVARIAPGTPASFNSIDAGNLVNWFTDSATGTSTSASEIVPTPALGAGRWLLLGGMLLSGLLALTSRARART